MSIADEIKARLDLVAYISETVPLKRAGRTYKARCPFHQERTPSFVVFPETQTWRCFGACGEGGDIFGFAMKQNGWDFKEALAQLAERAGVELTPLTPQQSAEEATTERLLGLLDEASRFFNRQLREAPEGEEARAYVERRKLNASTIEAFQIGYAPDGWQHAINHLTELGYSVPDIIEAGVAIRNEQGRVYDRFRHRLMIPIRDGRGRVIGFGARALRKEDQPKYLNSPQGPLFDKSKTLFALDMARREIRETETAIIVEGYMDAMQAHQAGFRNVIAQMGTALTDDQLQTLRRYADRLILALDPDEAGASATMRGLNVARESLNQADTALLGPDGSMRAASRMGIDMRVIVMPEGQDPDDLIRDHPEQWLGLVRNAEPVADYVIRVGTAGLDPARATVFEKEKIARGLLPLLTATESDLHREANVQKLALRLHLSEKRLMEIAVESRQAMAPRRTTDPRLRQRGRTAGMDQAAREWRRPQPPAPETPRPPVADEPPPFDWEEGPPPDYEAELPPEDDDLESPAPPESAPVRPGPWQPRPASQQEAYCLSILLHRPELLYQVNRAFREIAEHAQTRFADPTRRAFLQQALASLAAEDFREPGHQAIMRALGDALNQDAMEPLQYVEVIVGPALRPQIEALQRLYAPLNVFQERLRDPLRSELHSIQKQMQREGRITPGPESELIDKAFTLRRVRLVSDNEELRFLIQEASPEEKPRYQDVLDANDAAIIHLDRTLRQRASLAQS